MMNTKVQVVCVVEDAIYEEEVAQLGCDSMKITKGCSTKYTYRVLVDIALSGSIPTNLFTGTN